MTPAYKTITLELLPPHQRTLANLDLYALDLKRRHETYLNFLRGRGMDPLSLGSQSLELAIRDLLELLPS